MNTRVGFWLCVLSMAYIVATSPGCLSSEHRDEHAALWREIHETQRAVNRTNHRVDEIEAGRNEPVPPEWQAYPGDGR